MTDPMMLMMASSAALVGTGITCAAGLRAWNGWLELKRLELGSNADPRAAGGGGTSDIKELRERIRRLEAIASGIEI